MTPRPTAPTAALHVLVAPNRDGTRIYGPCAGIDLDPRCDSCARPGRHYSPGRCGHCALELRLRDLLGGPDGRITSQLEPVYRALSAAANPRSVIAGRTGSPNTKLLAQLAASGQTPTHELLDALPPGRHEFYVRQLLVTTGVLPERHDDLERLPSWLDTILDAAPAEPRGWSGPSSTGSCCAEPDAGPRPGDSRPWPAPICAPASPSCSPC